MVREIKEHSIREAEFLETGKALFFSRGYSNTSINDIIKSVGVAKGTFYHYFKSKEDLLDKIIENFMNNIYIQLDEIVNIESLGAVEKLNAAFISIRNIKFDNMELMIVLMNVLYKNENILLRHKMYEQMIENLTPVFAQIIEQGIKEKEFNCASPFEASELILAISANMNQTIVPMIAGIKDDPGIIRKIKNKITFFESSIERIIGSDAGKIRIFNMSDFDKFTKHLLRKNE